MIRFGDNRGGGGCGGGVGGEKGIDEFHCSEFRAWLCGLIKDILERIFYKVK